MNIFQCTKIGQLSGLAHFFDLYLLLKNHFKYFNNPELFELKYLNGKQGIEWGVV